MCTFPVKWGDPFRGLCDLFTQEARRSLLLLGDLSQQPRNLLWGLESIPSRICLSVRPGLGWALWAWMGPMHLRVSCSGCVVARAPSLEGSWLPMGQRSPPLPRKALFPPQLYALPASPLRN